jgi:hypothetical protein
VEYIDSTFASLVLVSQLLYLFMFRPGDYGSMVNEVVGTGDWDESSSLGEVRYTYAWSTRALRPSVISHARVCGRN